MLIEIPFIGYLGTSKVATTAAVGLLPKGITVGSVTDSTTTQDGLIVLNVTEGADLDNISNGKIIITFTIQEQKIAKYFTWCKTKTGADGSMVIYELKSSVSVLNKSIKDIITPNSITFTAKTRVSNSTTYNPYDGLFVIKESTNGATYETKYLSSSGEHEKTYILSSNKVVSVKCILCETDNLSNEMDSVTIPVLTDEGIKSEITEMKKTMSGISSNLDAVNKKFTDKVWQTDITTQINNYDGTTVNSIRDRVTKTEKDINGITNIVSDVESTLTKKADGSTVQALTERVSKAEQDAEGFKQTVEQNYIQKNDLQSSSRNLIRNSKNMIYKDYYLNSIIETYITDETGAYLTDETGNILTI